MPKAKPEGFSVDTHTYHTKEAKSQGREPYTCYRLLFNGECILKSSREETRDYVLSMMQEREAEKRRELADISA
jgi:hypothetical protein